MTTIHEEKVENDEEDDEVISSPSNSKKHSNNHKKQHYYCEVCDYQRTRNAHLLKHLTSNKHLLTSHRTEVDPNCKYQYENCNRKYRGQSGSWQHSKVCIVLAPPLVREPTIVEESVINDSMNLETYMNELYNVSERIEGLSNNKITKPEYCHILFVKEE